MPVNLSCPENIGYVLRLQAVSYKYELTLTVLFFFYKASLLRTKQFTSLNKKRTALRHKIAFIRKRNLLNKIVKFLRKQLFHNLDNK